MKGLTLVSGIVVSNRCPVVNTANELEGQRTGEDVTFEMFVPGEGLAAVGAEDHGCGWVLAAAARVGSTWSEK